jgi:threonine dehydratase
MADLPTPEQILAQREVIDAVFLNSPMLRHPALDEALGMACTLKIETLNPIRSFKGRGTESVVAALATQAENGVITTSTGNFGQGIAWAARRRGISATIVCPFNANPKKVSAMRRLGAEVILADESEGDGKRVAPRLASEQRLVFIEDGRHIEIAAGNGTIAQEMTEAGVFPDVVVIQIGDGSLAEGVGGWLKSKSPTTRVVGVVASGAPSMLRSLDAGHPVEVEAVTIADGMAIDMPIPTAIDLLPQVVDEFVSVDDDQIAEATRMLLDTAGIVAEPSGAAGVAALMQRLDFKGLEVASVITGSNLDPQLYARIFASR